MESESELYIDLKALDKLVGLLFLHLHFASEADSDEEKKRRNN